MADKERPYGLTLLSPPQAKFPHALMQRLSPATPQCDRRVDERNGRHETNSPARDICMVAVSGTPSNSLPANITRKCSVFAVRFSIGQPGQTLPLLRRVKTDCWRMPSPGRFL